MHSQCRELCIYPLHTADLTMSAVAAFAERQTHTPSSHSNKCQLIYINIFIRFYRSNRINSKCPCPKEELSVSVCAKQAVTSNQICIKCHLLLEELRSFCIFPPCRLMDCVELKQGERDVYLLLCHSDPGLLCASFTPQETTFSLLSLPLSLRTFKSNQFKGTLFVDDGIYPRNQSTMKDSRPLT